ncbi:hypothetical protein K2173_022900 [Erythroxylum novogranatense]|uniref:Uncharacterized protein n=1 Tax=Erythroxylum novogranatense TaxID=1862640 RepID=A0AAV8T7J6_9ROSI|nr:hypothetical protein K2173_022900 [Erythroxylum novogranatense]
MHKKHIVVLHHNMDRQERRREDNSFCYFHPKEVVIGVCAICLRERLLVLAAKQSRRLSSSSTKRAHNRNNHHQQGVAHKKPPINLPKIFALGSLLHRLEFRHSKSDNLPDDSYDASTSLEDSFISIKFEENGVASWEKGPVSKGPLEECGKTWSHVVTKEETKKPNDSVDSMSVIEHAKPHASLRWRKQIGHLLQLVRWKRSRSRSGKGSMCHVGNKVEGVKVRKGWIRTLTKRRTKE